MKNLLFLFALTMLLACDPPKKESQAITPETTVVEPVVEAKVSPEIDSTTVDRAPEEIVPKIEEQ